MFLPIKDGRSRGGYNRIGQQYARGDYLMLITRPTVSWSEAYKGMRAIVRHVHLYQCGHFMMGRMRIGPHLISVSGGFGSDGGPREVPDDVFDIGLPVPPAVKKDWNKDCHGAALAWAVENYPLLKRPYRAK